MRAEVCIDARFELGEGPVWDEREGTLYWVDITRCRVYARRLADGYERQWMLGQCVGAVALAEGGGLVVAMATGFYRLDENGALTCLARPDTVTPHVRFNDGKCDAKGKFWAGTLNLFHGETGIGSLYRVDACGNVRTMRTGITCSNGLAFSADGGTVYYIDTADKCVRVFAWDEAKGTLGADRVAVAFTGEAGIPDGMAIDDEGMLWVAHWGGGRVCRYDPADGATLARVEVPAKFTTSCCFGGPDMRTLFITSATEDDDSPHAGKIFCVDAGVSGPVGARFAG